MASLRVSLPRYDGSQTTNSTLENFLDAFDLHCEASGFVTDQQKVKALSQCLTDVALMWYQNGVAGWQDFSTWATTRAAFWRRFAVTDTAPSQMLLFDSLSQRRQQGEVVTAFGDRVTTAVRSIYSVDSLNIRTFVPVLTPAGTLNAASLARLAQLFHTAVAKHFFVAGLAPPLRQALLFAGPATMSFEELVQMAKRKEVSLAATPPPLAGVPAPVVAVGVSEELPPAVSAMVQTYGAPAPSVSTGIAAAAGMPRSDGRQRPPARDVPHPRQPTTHPHLVCDWCHGSGHIIPTCVRRHPDMLDATGSRHPSSKRYSGKRSASGRSAKPKKSTAVASVQPDSFSTTASALLEALQPHLRLPQAVPGSQGPPSNVPVNASSVTDSVDSPFPVFQ